jgi:hypothetical protein
MLGARCLGNDDHPFLAQQPGERRLGRGRVVTSGDGGERAVGEHAPLPERRVGHHRHLPLAAPRDEIELDPAALQIVEHLIGGDRVAAGERRPFLDVAAVEIADPVTADLAVALETQEPLQRLDKRDRAAPMQKVKVDPVGAEPLQAALAGLDDAGARSVVRIDLGYNEEPVAHAGGRLPHHLLGAA